MAYPNTYPFVNIAGKTSGGVSKPVLVANDGSLQVTVSVSPGSPASNFHLVNAGSGDANNVKSSPGTVWEVSAFNKGTAPVYLKFHNTAGTPTPGASVVRTVAIQAGVAVNFPFPTGLNFATGIGISIVTGITDASAVAATAGDVVVDIAYE